MKYGGLGLRSGKLVAGAQHVMSLQKCAEEMTNHTRGWNLEICVKESSESWLKKCIGTDFNMDKYLSTTGCTLNGEPKKKAASTRYPYSSNMSIRVTSKC